MTADPNVIDYGKYVIYRAQVFHKPAMLSYVPEAYKTYELCLAAFVFDEVNSLQYVPDRHKTYELCITAVKCSGTNYFFVPEEHRTEELKEAAMNQNRWLTKELLDGDFSPSGSSTLNASDKEPIGYNNASASGTLSLSDVYIASKANAEPGCCDDDISDIEEEPTKFLYDPDEYHLHTEQEVIHRFEFNNLLNTMAATLAY